MPNYVVVDTTTRKILGGPYSYDPDQPPVMVPDSDGNMVAVSWKPPEDGTLMTVAAARTGGYSWPVAGPPLPDSVLRDKLQQALQVNRAFLALPTPTNAQILQQVIRLTREMNAQIRLTLSALDDTSDS